MKAGTAPGAAVLAVKSAAARASYGWAMSVDAGKTSTEIPSTTKSRTTVSALPAATTVPFRLLSLTPEGQSDWSQPTSLLVK